MLATRAFHVSQKGHLWCSTIASTFDGNFARSSLAGFRPIQEAGSCRSTFSIQKEPNVTMVTRRTIFHHQLWRARMPTNSSHCWIAGCSIGSTILLILYLAGSSFTPAPLINLQSLWWIFIPPVPQTIGHTVLRTRCVQDL